MSRQARALCGAMCVMGGSRPWNGVSDCVVPYAYHRMMSSRACLVSRACLFVVRMMSMSRMGVSRVARGAMYGESRPWNGVLVVCTVLYVL